MVVTDSDVWIRVGVGVDAAIAVLDASPFSLLLFWSSIFIIVVVVVCAVGRIGKIVETDLCGCQGAVTMMSAIPISQRATPEGDSNTFSLRLSIYLYLIDCCCIDLHLL